MLKDVFWDGAPCSLVETDRRFRGLMMMEAVRTSETSVNFYEVHDAISQKTDIFMLAAVRP
jgi:hypothetical protein